MRYAVIRCAISRRNLVNCTLLRAHHHATNDFPLGKSCRFQFSSWCFQVHKIFFSVFSTFPIKSFYEVSTILLSNSKQKMCAQKSIVQNKTRFIFKKLSNFRNFIKVFSESDLTSTF